MRFSTTSFVLLLAWSDLTLADREKSLFKDDQSFWDRLLTDTESSVPSSTPSELPTPVPPVTPPPVTLPPVTPPPVTLPPVTPPPVTLPPVTEPPVTFPPVTEPPVTLPPVTEPPVTFPPVTEPPVTLPPVTLPPVTKPPTVRPPAVTPLADCITQIDLTCIPPVDPADPDGNRFEDCDSINIAAAECTEFVNLLAFRFNGGDCEDSNNIQDPRVYSCEDFFEGPPAADDFGAESYMTISDIKGQGIFYYDGLVAVGDEFNITNIPPNEVIIANVNVTVYDKAGVAPENIRETMIIHTSCSQVTFLKDRYGVLELIGFRNPSQGYQNCITQVYFDFVVENIASGFNAVVESLVLITNFPAPNDFLNYTEQVVGTPLGPGETLPLSTDPIPLDFSRRRRYTATGTVVGVAPDGFTCPGSDTLSFVAGAVDTRPTPSPA